MDEVNVPPVAALGMMVYGLPETLAFAAVPGLVNMTLPIVSPFCRPLLVKAVSVGVWP